MEGVSKICLDALSKAEEPSDWSISSITRDTAILSVYFFFYIIVSFAGLGDL